MAADALEYAQELIRFESTSSLSNVEISRHIERVLRALEFQTEWIEYQDARGMPKACVVGKKGEGTGGFAYFGHTDVVPADSWYRDDESPWIPVVRDERLYGRGSCDMKGSVACMLEAAGRFAPGQLRAPLYFVATADEEIGYTGASVVAERSRWFQEMLAHDTRGVIGEPTSLEVVHAHKGTCGFEVISKGRAAHSSTRHGLNANLAMIPFLQEMKAIHDLTESSEAWQDPRFDPPTMSWNIGINDHTRAVNITPARSICTVYFRPMPGQQFESLVERSAEAARRLGLEFKLHGCHSAFHVDPDSPYVREMLELAERSAPRTVCYGTDACVLGKLRRLVVFGPGDIAQAHTHDEWISLQQLKRGAELYARCIDRFCAQRV